MTERARAVRQYFDAVASSYAARYGDPGPAGHALTIRWRRLFELLGDTTGPALDAGCGPGLLIAALRERGMSAVGVDLSPGMAAEAARSGPIVLGALDQLPFVDRSFRLVVAMGAVEYVGDDRRALAEFVRVLRPGGVLLVSFPNRLSPYRLWKNAVFYPVVDRLRPLASWLRGRPLAPGVTAYHHHYTDRAVRAALEQLGCVVEDVVFVNMQLLPSPLDEWLPWLSVAISRRLERFGRGFAGRLGTAFLARAVRWR
jgi:SAM-dependent methyltransferase